MLILGSYNQITDRGLAPLAGLTSLTSLEISPAAALSDAVFALARALPNLQNLKLEKCQQITASGLAQLHGCRAVLDEVAQVGRPGHGHSLEGRDAALGRLRNAQVCR